ncbi:MAG TPA: AMP-dependent synthetase/ligase [Bacteroidales bacterium]|nr:AMP-dependent synthetase/ligase [Bacteroidales bacterium]HRZ49894.1 AMP-dependent synthetase/ligase [Bacteroidales bacterium]
MADYQVARLFDIVDRSKALFSFKNDVLAGKEDGQWKRYSAEAYFDIVEQISYGLIALGVQPGDRIATILNSRPEWNFLDMAIMRVGAIHIPVYPTISQDDYRYILNHAEVVYVFLAGKELYHKIEGIEGDIPSLKEIFTIKDWKEFRHLGEVIELGKQNPVPEELEQRMAKVLPDDLATIIYTSGTTGQPKGVMLSHRNIITNFLDCEDIPPIKEQGCAVSYLPLCHIYERMINYLFQYVGLSIYYAESIATIADNIKEIRPHIFTTVPRLIEKVYDKIIAKGRDLKGIKKQLFFRAVKLALKFEPGVKYSVGYRLQLKLARKLIFSKWQAALGGRIMVIISGGAALQPRLARTFWAAGMPILEGYGLTESSPVIAVNLLEPGACRVGTVGPALAHVEVKIAEDQEILARGPSIMQGYYKDPGLTAATIDEEGWLHTGDMGRMVDGRFLQITGRKKELFKTSFGKYIAPGLIEDKLKESPFIDNAIVVGENQKFAAALLVPDFLHLKAWCHVKEIPFTSPEEMVQNPSVRQRFRKEIDRINQNLGNTEQIKKFELLPDEWSQPTGELTPKMSVKRDVIHQRYQELIGAMFA